MYACDHLEQGVLNALRGTEFTAPAACYLGLFVSDPGETGTAGIEVSYAGYQRMKIEFSVPAEESGGIGIKNTEEIKFAVPSEAAGAITHIGVLDSQTAGNMLARGPLTDPLTVKANQPPVVIPGDVLFYLTGNMTKVWKTKVLNLFRGQSISAVEGLYYALWNGSPESAGAELTGENYARTALTFGAPEEQISGQYLIKNTNETAFPRPTTAWGTWSWSAVCTAATAGEVVYAKELGEAVELKRGYMPTIATGAVELGLN